MSFQALQIIGTVISAKAQMDAGKARKRQYEAQAAEARLKGRRDALVYRQRALEKLRQMRQTTSSIVARTAAGNSDPFSGTGASLTNYVTGIGYEDAGIFRDNAEMSINAGIIQQQQYLTAGDEAMRQGRLGAMTTLFLGGAQAMKTSVPSPQTGPGYYSAPSSTPGYTDMTYVPSTSSPSGGVYF